MRSDRLLALLLLLQARGRTTAPEVAEQLEVSVRTVYRDVEALSAAGVPVYTEQGRGGGIAILPGYRTDVSGLTVDEARALFAFSGRGTLSDAVGDAALRSAFRKLLAALPAEQRAQAVRAEERILVDPYGWMRRAEPVPALPILQQAAVEGRILRITYRPRGGEPAERVVEPVGVVAKAGTWYLVARRDGQVRTYRVARVSHAELTERVVPPHERPALGPIWDSVRTGLERPVTTYEVTMAVAPGRLDRVLDALHTQVVDEPGVAPGRGGGHVVTARVRTLDHAVQCLLPLHPMVEAVAPAELRAALREAALEVAARYA